MKVEFTNVGRNKKSWIADLPVVNDARLHEAVKKSGALASRDIDFTFEDDEQSGEVLVGGFRAVGTWKVIQ